MRILVSIIGLLLAAGTLAAAQEKSIPERLIAIETNQTNMIADIKAKTETLNEVSKNIIEIKTGEAIKASLIQNGILIFTALAAVVGAFGGFPAINAFRKRKQHPA